MFREIFVKHWSIRSAFIVFQHYNSIIDRMTVTVVCAKIWHFHVMNDYFRILFKKNIYCLLVLLKHCTSSACTSNLHQQTLLRQIEVQAQDFLPAVGIYGLAIEGQLGSVLCRKVCKVRDGFFG